LGALPKAEATLVTAGSELVEELERAGFWPVDCVYGFRDRVALRAERPPS